MVEAIVQRATLMRDMVPIPGGEFLMGSERFYPEERPKRRVAVDGFSIDRGPVTVAEFRRFVDSTGYVTVAERPLDPADFPGADPGLLVPGSLVFSKTPGPVDLRDVLQWWDYKPGATWRDGPDEHPVTHVAFEDAQAYAAWAGKELPTEAEWERAARGGLEDADFAWGNEHSPGGRAMANTWRGQFPWENLSPGGGEGTSPVGAFPPNAYGLHDVTGNVWEWTSDLFAERPPGETPKACCGPTDAGTRIERRVIKGGSHLCAPNYCLRYRPSARQAEGVDTSTQHIGFRCIVRAHQR
jgi:sulfatase modifying factor 1